MTITICASIEFVDAIRDAAQELQERGHTVVIPKGTQMLLDGTLTVAEVQERKDNGTMYELSTKYDAIRAHYNHIKQSDAILVLNLTKKGIQNYIGPNAFLEIGFAYVLDKKIFLLHDIPDMPAKDEMLVMQPTVINGDLKKLAL